MNDLEPSNGTFNWAHLDNVIADARGAGITSIVYTFWSTPEWASSDSSQSCVLTASQGVTGCAAHPANINDWETFVKSLVAGYGSVILYYDLWNEANLNETYSESMSEMLTMAQHAYDGIKAEPSAVVLAPSVSRVGVSKYSTGCVVSECWLASYLRDGGGTFANGIAYHLSLCMLREQHREF